MELFRLLGTVALEGTDQVERDLNNTRDSASETSKTFEKVTEKIGEWSIKIATATAAAASAIGGVALASSTNLQQAFNDFTAATGTATEELEACKEVLQEIYNNNYGESYEDIADAMAQIKQQIGDIDSGTLKSMTEDAILLRDTFDYEVGETTRAAKMLMDQFGISGKEAFNLIAQGTQNGLNKNGDLLDSINEYSVHYKQMGYDAKSFFNSLANGTKAGTFSVDKLGDAMKEFGIRVKDTSTTTSDAFALLGYGAEEAMGTVTEEGIKITNSLDELQAKFAEGGDAAQEATAEVIQALFAMDDKVAQNAAGVGLFGTMWEDLGVEGIKALTDVEGSIDSATDALTDMSEVKYDDLGTQFEGLKRKMETSLIQPLGKKLQPMASKLLTTIEKKMPQLQKLTEKLGDIVVKIMNKLEPALEWLIDDVLPVLVDILGFCIDNFEILAGTIATVYGAIKTLSIIKTLTTAIEGASGAMGVFNAVLNANPIGAVLTAVGLLAAGIGLLVIAMEEEETETEKAKRLAEERIKVYEDETQAILDAKEATKAKAEEELTEVANVERLWNELQTLCDETGKVNEADKARADFILNELNEALGTEYTMTGNQIDNYKSLQDEINNTIELKKAEILMAAAEEDYTEAVKNRTAKEEELRAKLEEVAKQQEICNQFSEEYQEMVDKLQSGEIEMYQFEEWADKANAASTTLEGFYDELAEIQTGLQEYYTSIAVYEGAQAELLAGNTETAIELLDSKNQSYLKASDIVGEATQEQMALLENQVVQAGVQMGVLQDMLNNCADEQEATYQRLYDEATTQYETMKEEFIAAGGDAASQFNVEIERQLNSYSDARRATGAAIINDTVGGMTDTATLLAERLRSSGLLISDEFAQGIAQGITNNQGFFNSTLGKFLNTGLTALKNAAEIHSPSRLFAKEVGAYIPSGVAMGIEENESDAIDPMRDMIGKMSTLGNADVVNNYSSSASSITNNYSGDSSSMEGMFAQMIDAMRNLKIYLNGDTLVGELAPAMDMALGDIATGNERGH